MKKLAALVLAVIPLIASAGDAEGDATKGYTVVGSIGTAPDHINSIGEVVSLFNAPAGWVSATIAAASLICGKSAVTDPAVLRARSSAYDYFLGLSTEGGRLSVPDTVLQAKATKALTSAKCDKDGVLQL